MIVTARTLRIVGTIDLEAVLQEIAQSSPEEITAVCIALCAEAGEDVSREVIAGLNDLEWVEEEVEEGEEEL